MRAVLAVLMLCPAVAVADPGPLSHLDEVPLFNSTEVYHLEPGTFRVAVQGASGEPASQPTMQIRAEVGLTEHFQLRVAEDLTAATGQNSILSAAPIAVRYSLGRMEDQVLGNPAVEAQFIPRANGPARAGLRLIAGEEVMPRVVVAMNAYLEQNLNRQTVAGVDGTFGMTGGISYALVPGLLQVGGEGQLGEAQYGLPDYYFVAALGPNAVLQRGPFALTASCLANIAGRQVGLEPKVMLSTTF